MENWLEAAKYREGGGDDGAFDAGIDVAGPGEDETVLCVRRGPRIVLLTAWSGHDPRGDVLAALLPFKGRLNKVNVDTVGIGYYLAQHFRDQRLPVQEINVGEKAHDTEKYVNRKAEVYWGLRRRAQDGDLAGLTDERTIAQLAGIRYSHNSRGQIVIESKEDARKRGVKSPDRAEAVMLAFAERRTALGVIEYLKAEQARLDVARPGGPQGPEGGWRCPKCDAICVSRLAT